MTMHAQARRINGAARVLVAAIGLTLLGLIAPRNLYGQFIISDPEAVISIAQGTSALIDYPGELTRVSVTDVSVAEALPVDYRVADAENLPEIRRELKRREQGFRRFA